MFSRCLQVLTAMTMKMIQLIGQRSLKTKYVDKLWFSDFGFQLCYLNFVGLKCVFIITGITLLLLGKCGC